MTTVLEKFGINPVTVTTPKGLDYVGAVAIRSTHAVGIEVEVEAVAGIGSIPKGSVWTAISDGSLRNNGMEFITTPIPANFAPAALNQLMTQILHQQCSFSPRTSVHVHLNVQDLQMHEALDFVLLYSVFEKLFYKFAGRGRIRNIFCVPITETDLLGNLIAKGVSKRWSKYTGLNLCPLSTSGENGTGYGTIEFRHMHGTFDVEKLSVWINFITMLKEYVLKTDTKTIRTMLLAMDDNFDFGRLLFDIFGDYAGNFKFGSNDEIKSCYMAVRTAMLNDTIRNKVGATGKTDSAFYKFKG